MASKRLPSGNHRKPTPDLAPAPAPFADVPRARGEDDAHPLAVAPPTTREQRADVARIVRRLEAIVINHTEGARRIHHPLTHAQVLAVIDALRGEAEGRDRPAAFSDGEVTFYLMDGLYEELLGEPSNIFSTVATAGGAVRFEPLQREFWLGCLESLRHRIERLG